MLRVTSSPQLAEVPSVLISSSPGQGGADLLAPEWSTAIVPNGPKLWLRGDVVQLNGSGVSVWPDQSGHGNHVRQVTAIKQPAWVASDASYNGRSTLNFLGSKWMVSDAFAQAILQPCTWYIVGHTHALTTDYRVFADGIDVNRHIITTNVSSGLLYAYAGASIYTDVPGAAPHILTLVVNGGSSEYHVNSYRTPNVGGNMGALPLTGLTLGAVQGGVASFLNGTMAEVLVFPGAHTQAQRRAVQRYLSARYNKIVLARTRDLRGLYRSTMGVSLGAGGVQQWDDQSGLGHHLLQPVAASQPAHGAVSGRIAVSGDGVDDLLDAAFALSGADTVFTFSKWNTAPGAQSTLFDGGGGGVGNQNRFYRTPAGNPAMYANGAGLGSTGVDSLSWHINTCIFNGAASSLRQDGAEVASGTTGTGASQNGFRLFAFGSGGDFADASVAEAMIFAGALPLDDVQALEADLAAYYAGSLPAFPGGVPGLRLWVDASLGLTFSGGKVSAWADQSGRANHLTQGFFAYQPSYASGQNGKPAVQFDGSNDELKSPVFTRGRPHTIVLFGNYIGTPIAGAFDGVSVNAGRMYVNGLGVLDVGGSLSPPYTNLGNFHVHVVIFGQAGIDGTTGSYRQEDNVPTYGDIGSSSDGLTLGNLGGGYSYNSALLAYECLIYPRALSAEELAAIIAYGRAKYAI